MRRLETENAYLYYREGQREQALRVAARLEGCAGALREHARLHTSYARAKMVIVMPDFAYNNAFVAGPGLGQEAYSVIPTHNTFDFTSETGLPGDPSYIGCHEVVHYVQLMQVDGVWRWLNTIFGELITPHLGLDGWFVEGLATFYESRLQPGAGRMSWPVWRGMFHAGVAEDPIGGGDLSGFKRASQWGNQYHVGSFFIEFLVERYGEDKLWHLIAVQGRSFFFPLWVSLRFKYVYGKSLSALIDEFAAWTAERFPPRSRPPGQRRIRDLGLNARYARAPSGAEAVLAYDHDQPPRLYVYRPDGSLWHEQALADLLPPRRVVSPGAPALSSGLSFTADGRYLYFTLLDQGSIMDVARLIAFDVERGVMRVARTDIGGVGGAISPDGAIFYLSRPRGDRMDLVALDPHTGGSRVVVEAGPREYLLQPAPSPDGARLVVSAFDPADGFTLRLYRSDGAPLGAIDTGGRRAYGASFATDDRVVFLAEHEGRFQVFVHDLGRPGVRRVSDAPYLAFAPRAGGGTVRFLNREGWGWTLDEVALPAPTTAPAPSSDPVSEAAPAPVPGAGPDPVSEAAPGLPPAATPAATSAATSAAPGASAVRVTAPGASAVRATPVTAPPRVLSDSAYSQFDHLFVPQLHSIAAIGVDEALLLGLTLSGADRLSFHNWSLTGVIQPGSRRLGGALAYVNTQLAPVIIGLSASQFDWEIELRDQDDNLIATRDRLQRDADLFVQRSFYGSVDLTLAALYTDDQRPDDDNLVLRRRRLAGPALALSYQAGEATAFTGRRRVLGASIEGALYPAAVNSLDESFTDLRAQLDLTLPLPLSHRHALDLRLRGRTLFGLDDYDLIQVGGLGTLASLYQRSDGPEPPRYDADQVLPPRIRFVELLRGFEDYPIGTDRIAIADATYRYPLIIDRGFASTLWVLPALFFRQIDFELFAAGALRGADLDQHLHAAAGGSVALDLALWLVPLTVRYQLAQRLTDDEALVHDVAFGLTF